MHVRLVNPLDGGITGYFSVPELEQPDGRLGAPPGARLQDGGRPDQGHVEGGPVDVLLQQPAAQAARVLVRRLEEVLRAVVLALNGKDVPGKRA